MLRRVGRILRVALLGLGLALFVWTVVSYFVFLGFHASSVRAFSMRSLLVISLHNPPIEYRGFEGYMIPTDERELSVGTLVPTVTVFSGTDWAGTPYGTTLIRIPLWLLAFICLAWPVTSFIIARRRRKGRGFEVEARPGAALPPPES